MLPKTVALLADGENVWHRERKVDGEAMAVRSVSSALAEAECHICLVTAAIAGKDVALLCEYAPVGGHGHDGDDRGEGCLAEHDADSKRKKPTRTQCFVCVSIKYTCILDVPI